MAGFFGEYLDTIGIELEGIGIERKSSMANILQRMNSQYPQTENKITITHDASTEFNASWIRTLAGLVLISNHTPEMADIFGRKIVGTVVMGYELVTSPLEVSELGGVLYPLISTLTNHGDFISDRAATHFHVGFVNNLRLLQNFLRIALMVDPVMYRLGGMGRTFRGKINQSAYSRPLLNSVAVHIHNRSNFAQIVNPIAALEAESLEQFWASFGLDYRNGGGGQKYHACRYGGFNFYAVPQHGTMEFRHCNQSHDTFLIIAIAKFDRALVELSTVISRRELSQLSIVPSNTEISVGDATEIINRLMALCREHEIENLPDDYEMETIIKTISNSHFESIPETPVLVHLQDGMNVTTMEIARKGKLKTFDKVLPPHYVDIHTITYNSIFDGVEIQNSGSQGNPEYSIELEESEIHNEEEEEFDDEENSEEEDE